MGSNPVLRGDAHGTRACAEKLRKTPGQRLKSSQVWPRMIAVEVRRLVARNPSTVPDTLSLSRRSGFHVRSTVFCENVRMNDEYPLALRQADAARTDFALLEQHMEFLASRIARLPTRAYLCRTLLLATASLWALLAAVLLLLR